MITIGLTGGMGSGKSTVAKVFENLGVPVFNSDIEAKACYEDDERLREAIKEKFGNEVFDANGALKRDVLAKKVFGHPEELNALNRLVHPALKRRFEAWRMNQMAHYVMKEAAILFESGAHAQTDLNILVSAPVDLRMERIRLRDQMTVEEINQRISAQWPEEKLRSLCDFEIVNDGRLLLPQIIFIHENILRRANS